MTDQAYKDGYNQIDWSKHVPWEPKPVARPTGRSDLACPHFISDTMPATEHVDGNFYESKAAFRAVTRREGMIELGNDPQRHKLLEKQTSTKEDRRAAIDKAVTQTLGA